MRVILCVITDYWPIIWIRCLNLIIRENHSYFQSIALQKSQIPMCLRTLPWIKSFLFLMTISFGNRIKLIHFTTVQAFTNIQTDDRRNLICIMQLLSRELFLCGGTHLCTPVYQKAGCDGNSDLRSANLLTTTYLITS